MRILLLSLAFVASLLGAVNPVPPPGIQVTPQDRKSLEAGLNRLKTSIDTLKGNALLPDVMIYHKAVRFALEGNEFFKPDEILNARWARTIPP